MPGMVLVDVALRCWLYLAVKPSHMGVDADRLACHLHHPTTCSRQIWGQGFLSSDVLSRHCSGRWCLSRSCETPGLEYLVER
jgi:hypothetical protein